MATLPTVLVAQTGVPAQVEAKFSMLPKLSTYMAKIANMLPAGPDVFPSQAAIAPVLPDLPNIFQGPTTTGARATRADYMGPGNGGVYLMPGKPPVGLQTERIATPNNASTKPIVITRRGA